MIGKLSHRALVNREFFFVDEFVLSSRNCNHIHNIKNSIQDMAHRLVQHLMDWNGNSPGVSAYRPSVTHVHAHGRSLHVSALFSLQLCTHREGLLAGEGLTRERERPICHVCREPCVRSWLLQACHL